METIDLIIPAYHSGKRILTLLDLITRQTIVPAKVIIMNTEEEYFINNPDLGKAIMEFEHPGGLQIQIYHVQKKDFDHGLTRDEGIRHGDSEYILCMTDDAIPADQYLIERLLQRFKDNQVAVAYARQLPAKNCDMVEQMTRTYNYPEQSIKKTNADIETLGIKTFFCSNVCAMYRRSVYEKLGGFTRHTIFNEDMIFAAQLIQKGYAVFYSADAAVYHSHNYNCRMQLHRNFDLGVSQADHPEIFAHISSEREGASMVGNISRVLCKRRKFIRLFYFYMQCAFKLVGFRLGKHYKHLPRHVIMFLTMNREYWSRAEG